MPGVARGHWQGSLVVGGKREVLKVLISASREQGADTWAKGQGQAVEWAWGTLSGLTWG